MRKKPNLLPRMERCAELLVNDAAALKGRWLESFIPGRGGQFERVILELGCGKGQFTVLFAGEHPKALVAALERVKEALVVAMERAGENDAHNLRFIAGDAAALQEYFAPGEVSDILINFCDPWPRTRHEKKRLTSPDFLKIYDGILCEGGALRLKTDNVPLFEWSLRQLSLCGWRVTELTRDLHENGVIGPTTDYEEKFRVRGIKINYLSAAKERSVCDSSHGM